MYTYSAQKDSDLSFWAMHTHSDIYWFLKHPGSKNKNIHWQKRRNDKTNTEKEQQDQAKKQERR